MNLGQTRVPRQIVAAAALLAIGVPGNGYPGIPLAAAGIRAGALDGYDLDSSDPVQYDISRSMREVSGLAMNARGQLFAHNDERAIVARIDPATGETVETFRAGRNGVRADFEGMTFAGSRIFLVASGGEMLEFAEGGNDESVEYTRADIGSDKQCREIEGLDYDASNNALLLVCKFTRTRALRDHLVILRYSLRSHRLEPEPAYSIPLDFLEARDLDTELSPSGLAIHPRVNTLFILAARENLIVEMDRSGEVLGVAKLRGKVHHQAEGIAFASDGTMYIADEGGSGKATLTVYPYSRASDRESVRAGVNE